MTDAPSTSLAAASSAAPSELSYLDLGKMPDPNEPVTVDSNGTPVSRFRDSIWRLWPLSGKALTLNFGDGARRRDCRPIDPVNALLLRRLVWLLMFGVRFGSKATTIKSQFKYLRSVFLHCSANNVVVDQLSRYPAVIRTLAEAIPPSRASECVELLHRVWLDREVLGFVVLDEAGLALLSNQIATHDKQQTPYISPRIWTYQVLRLAEFITDFLNHREALYKTYMESTIAYEDGDGDEDNESPTQRRRSSSRRKDRRYYGGTFSDLAQANGVDAVLEKWLLPPGSRLGDSRLGIRSLNNYLCLATLVGNAYLINFGLMRISEAWSLRCNCFDVENDKQIGNIYFIHGETTKTDQDDDARWIVSATCKRAVDMMAFVARMRIPATGRSAGSRTLDESGNPYLARRSLEPWSSGFHRNHRMEVRPMPPSYGAMINLYPNLFDPEQLRITEEDIEVARRITPTLDPTKYAVGEIWPLAWHQLRRSGAVNMLASGLVSETSLQFELKHTNIAMTMYYAHGYSRIGLDPKARAEYVRSMYEVVGRQLAATDGGRYVSPHGEKRKAQALGLVSKQDVQTLSKLAKQGKVWFRETALGACMRRGSCPYGGVDNLVRCAGADGHRPCADTLYDREKLPKLRNLRHSLLELQRGAAPDSPRFEALAAQILALENAIHVIER